jgi:hypothetical protein
MATKGALSSLPKLTPAYGLEEGETDDAVERATQKVMQAYSARQNLGYDPVLMGFGQAMLASRGNFGEGLGAGLKGAQEAQQQVRQQDIENAQAQLTLAQAEREQQNARRSQGAFMSTIGGGAPKPDTGGLPSGEAVQPAASGAASGQAPAGIPVTIDSALKYAATFPAAKDNARLLMDAAKAGLDRYLISQNGTVFDKMSGKYLPQDIPGQAQTDYSTPLGRYKMTANEYSKLQAAQDKGLGNEWMEAFKYGSTKLVDDVVSGTSTKPLELVKSTDGKTPQRLSESEAEVQSELRKSATGQEAGRRKVIVDNADEADNSIELAQQFRAFSNDPDAKLYQGILSNDKTMSAIIKLAQSGIGVPGFSIGIPEIETVVKNLNLKGEAQAKAQVYAMLLAQMQLSKTKFMKGAVSNYEQGLMGRAGVSSEDTPDSVRAKADLLERRATFDKDIARLYKKVGGDVSDFKQTDDYKKLKDQYIEDLKGLALGLKRIPSTTPGKPTEKGKRDNASAAEKLD